MASEKFSQIRRIYFGIPLCNRARRRAQNPDKHAPNVGRQWWTGPPPMCVPPTHVRPAHAIPSSTPSSGAVLIYPYPVLYRLQISIAELPLAARGRELSLVDGASRQTLPTRVQTTIRPGSCRHDSPCTRVHTSGASSASFVARRWSHHAPFSY